MSEPNQFNKFTERARKVLSLAQEEAQRFHHNYIGTEHILLGLVREGDSVAAKVLRNLGIDLEKARSAVEFIIGHGNRIVLGEIGLTPRAKKVIELAVDEAKRLNHHYIGTEHLLLGLIREGGGIGAGVLESLGASLEKVRTATLQVLSGTQSVAADEPVEKPSTVFDRNWLRASLRQFENPFADQIYKILYYAGEEALHMQQNTIGPEHVLVGLLRDQENVAASVLSELGVNLERLRESIKTLADQLVPQGEMGVRGFSHLAQACLHLAADEAERRGHTALNAAHVLLGLTREPESIIATILKNLGTDVSTVRQKLLEAL